MIRVPIYSPDDELRRREAVEEHTAVGLGEDAGIEDHHAAPILGGADEPTEALLELERRLRHLILHERIPAGSPDCLDPRRHQRPVITV